MKLTKQILCLILAVLMMFAVVACGGDPEDTQNNNQGTGQAGLANHVQHQTSARTTHAHHAGNTKVQVTGLLGDDLTRGAVHERGTEGQGTNEKIQPGVHFRTSFPA